MTEERKTLLNEITEDLKHLDQKSLELMRTGVTTSERPAYLVRYQGTNHLGT